MRVQATTANEKSMAMSKSPPTPYLLTNYTVLDWSIHYLLCSDDKNVNGLFKKYI